MGPEKLCISRNRALVVKTKESSLSSRVRVGRAVYASDIADLLHLEGRRVRIRNGKRTFVGVLRSTATRKFPKGKNLHAVGLVLEGPDFRVEFAWWEWDVCSAENVLRLEAAE
jgi:hypothetical protein